MYDTHPTEWATIQHSLGIAYSERIEGERKANLERAISYYEAALRVRTREAFPIEWAAIQQSLGSAYKRRIEGERWVNLERAIAYYQAALQTYTYETSPRDWARAQYSLGGAYVQRIAGERRANLEQAIACFEAALQVRTRDVSPMRWAMTWTALGSAYNERIEGEWRANQERAIACYETALEVYTPHAFPVDWAMTQHNLGNAYAQRIAGERRSNMEQAITHYEAALQIYTRDAFPTNWALTRHCLGTVYHHRIAGKREVNQEEAIACFEDALQIHTRETFPAEWAITQTALGRTYYERIAGEQRVNLEQAMACYEGALQIYTRKAFPEKWAMLQHNLGNVYNARMVGMRRTNLQQAIAHFAAALQVYTREAFPIEWAMTQHNLGAAYYKGIAGEEQISLEQAIAYFQAALQMHTRDALPREHHQTQIDIAVSEAKRQNWMAAHVAYKEALATEDVLVRLGAGVVGHDTILKEGRSAAINDGFALIRLGQVAEAAITIERGRARWLSEALALDAADPMRISDAGRRKQYEEARQQFIAAQSAMNDTLSQDLPENVRRRVILECTEAYHKALEVFDSVLAEIRAAQDPADFLEDTLDAPTILDIAAGGGAGHTLVYLAGTLWGGIAIAALSANPSLGTPARFAALDLPALTEAFVGNLLETRFDNETQSIIGGYLHAQEGNGFGWVMKQWAGETFHQSAERLHRKCIAEGKTSTLDRAVQEMLATSTSRLTHLVDLPVNQLDTGALMALVNTLGHFFLQEELRRCMEQLAEAAMRPLVAWLLEQGATSLSLIPCGALAAFPLAAVPLADGRTVGETLPTSVALCARSLLYNGHIAKQRAGVYALGDPRPTYQELCWGEAEAHTLAKLARDLGLPGKAKVHQRAVRSWLIQALQAGFVVDASCHGKFDSNDFLQSSLWLGRGERLFQV